MLGALRGGGVRLLAGGGGRSYSCQKLSEQISIRARVRPVLPMERAREDFWGSGRLPAQVHGDKRGPLWVSVGHSAYMKLARKPHIQRKLLRLEMEDENGVPTGETHQVLTDKVHEKMPFSRKWNEDYDYVTFRRWPRVPPLKLRIPFETIGDDQCAEVRQ